MHPVTDEQIAADSFGLNCALAQRPTALRVGYFAGSHVLSTADRW